MKLFDDETDSAATERADELVEVAVLVMRLVRAEVKRQRPAGVTYSQVRAIGFLEANPGASLSEVAEHLGVQAPTASKLVEELVQQGLVEREVAAEDRRRVTLRASAAGRRALRVAGEPARARVEEVLAPLSAEERAVVRRALRLLRPLFLTGGACEGEDGRG